MLCFFTSDLHGDVDRLRALVAAVVAGRPDALFLGGDLLPGLRALAGAPEDALFGALAAVREALGRAAPRVFAIMGNDDARADEPLFLEAEREGLLEYVHARRAPLGPFVVYGYAYVPPTPFALKDWERWDVSRFLDAGCVSPEEGVRSVEVPDGEPRNATIAEDLARLAGDDDQSRAIWLFHAPPHRSALDRLGRPRLYDGASLDRHVGSIAVRRFIETRGPLVTLHGHIHESAAATGSWRDRIGRAHCFTGAHDGAELPLVRFDPADLEAATRVLVPPLTPQGAAN